MKRELFFKPEDSGDSEDSPQSFRPEFAYPLFASPDLGHFTIEEIRGYQVIYPVDSTGQRSGWGMYAPVFAQKIRDKLIKIDRQPDGRLHISESGIPGHWVAVVACESWS